MDELADFQHLFQAYLLHEDDRIGRLICGENIQAVQQRLNIYRDGYYLRLCESLTQVFPCLVKVMKQNKFDQLARHYIDSFPSSYFSLRDFGHQISKYLENYLPNKPYLAEMARFEWLLAASFDAADEAHLTIEEVAKVDPQLWPQMCFQLQPSVHYLTLSYNTQVVWAAFRNNEPMLGFKKIKSSVCVIWRKNFTVHFKDFSPAQMYVLQQIEQGSVFDDICIGLCAWMNEEDVATYAATLLKQLINDEFLSWRKPSPVLNTDSSC